MNNKVESIDDLLSFLFLMRDVEFCVQVSTWHKIGNRYVTLGGAFYVPGVPDLNCNIICMRKLTWMEKRHGRKKMQDQIGAENEAGSVSQSGSSVK
jgi:hypothetical protein